MTEPVLTLQGFEMFPCIPENRCGQCGREPFDRLGKLEPFGDPLSFIPIRIANEQLADTDLGFSLPLFDRHNAIDQPLGASEDLIDLGQLGRQCIVIE